MHHFLKHPLTDEVMTVDDLAQWLQVSPSTIYRMLKVHSVPFFKVGSDYRFRSSELRKWLETTKDSLT